MQKKYTYKVRNEEGGVSMLEIARVYVLMSQFTRLMLGDGKLTRKRLPLVDRWES